MLIAFQQFILFLWGWATNQKQLWNSKTHAQRCVQWLSSTTVGLDKGLKQRCTTVLLKQQCITVCPVSVADSRHSFLFLLSTIVIYYQAVRLPIYSTSWSIFQVASQTDAATFPRQSPARVGQQRGQLPDQLRSEQITLIWLKDAVGRQRLLTSGAFTVRTAASSSLIYSFTGPNVFTPLHDAMNILHHRCFCTGF